MNLIVSKKRNVFVFVLFLSFCLFSSSIFACSAFMLKGKNYHLIGFNENWKTMPGMVVVNRIGIEKQNLSWNQLVSDTKIEEPKVTWKSKYGSVSFNLLGVDLPCFGINDKGLFIVELYLDKTYSISENSKANMFWGQWIQYQLDNFATVDEVLTNLNNSPTIDWWPTFPGSHFFVTDKSGNTAAIELLNGVFHIYNNETMPIPVLCNSPYEDEVKNLHELEQFGGSKPFDVNTREWNDRFAKAAVSIKNYDETKKAPIDFSWQLLDDIYAGEWQMVTDVKNGMIYFRSDVGKEIKSIDLSTVDFTQQSPLLYLDINSNLSGNVLDKFGKMTPETNRQYIEKGFPVGYENNDFYQSQAYINLKNNLDKYLKLVYNLK